jgi:hypothetical protein
MSGDVRSQQTTGLELLHTIKRPRPVAAAERNWLSRDAGRRVAATDPRNNTGGDLTRLPNRDLFNGVKHHFLPGILYHPPAEKQVASYIGLSNSVRKMKC